MFAGGDAPLAQPSIADWTWVVADLLLAAGLVLALTRRERPLMVMLDIAAFVIGAGLIVGIAIVEPALHDPDRSLGLQISQVAYVVCDVALIAGIVRTLLAPRGRPGALWLLAAGAACLVASDILWNHLMLSGDYVPGQWADIGWGVYPLLIGLAAVVGSMRRVSELEDRTDAELHATGPLVLGMTSLIAPSLLAAHSFTSGMPDINREDALAVMLGGALLCTLVVIRFMLLTRRARRLVDRSEERYQQLVEEVPAVVVMFEVVPGREAVVPVYVSPQAEAIVGLSAEEWLADPDAFASLIHPDDLAMLAARLAAHAGGVPDSAPEFRVTRPDGEEIWLRDVSGVLAGGRYLHSMLVDITEAKRAEADRDRMESELRLAQKLEAVGQLAAGIAHEINTPTQFVGDTIEFLRDAFGDLLELIDAYGELELAARTRGDDPALIGRIDELKDVADLDYLRERIPPAFERGADGVSRVATIVRAMRDFAHPPTSEKAPVDVAAALRDTLIVAANAYKYVADVETEFDDLPPIMGNAGELNQVFLNLVVNAAHAIESSVAETGGRGRILLRARRDRDYVLISITDSGCGIPANVAARVFDPFFTTKEVGRGTGQGLAIARTMVVDHHGGTIAFETEPGFGTTFHVRLPIGGSDIEAAAA